VEDEVLIRALVAEELRAAGFSVLEAVCADDALSYFKAGVQVDLVFSDVQMPGSLDGLQLARQLRKEYPRLPIILTSGNRTPSRDKDVTFFVPKPYDVRETIGIIVDSLKEQQVNSSRCILIVEAEELVRGPLAEYLRACGHHVLEAVNADEARRLLGDGDRRIDIVLADINVAGPEGFSLAQ
jgi:CheY-like chemotaxis protein